MFDQQLSCVTFERIQAVLAEMTTSLLDPYALVTDADVITPGTARFSVLVSLGFSALLKGTAVADGYQTQLIVKPVAIATFLKTLPPQPNVERLLTLQNRRANRAKLQSQFSTRVLQTLVTDLNPSPGTATCQPMVDAALHQQLAQERLLRQVTSQIRQGLELSIILQTAVEQVRTFLQADRLTIYQFVDIDPAVAGIGGIESTPTVTYEALATEQISSVLSTNDEYCWDNASTCRTKYCQGQTIAIEDVETHYTDNCLLEYLRDLEIRAKLITPIVVKSQVWGLLIAHQCSGPRHWQDHEKVLLRRISDNLEIAIYQARLYRQLQQQKHTLEEQVTQRTQELQRAFVELQAANQAKGEFVATMSHELRTPLTCVIGMSATLLRWSLGPLSDKQKSYIQRIHDSGEQLLELINDILDFSHAESGKATLELSEFSLASLTQQSLHMVRAEAQTHEVHLSVEVEVAPELDRFTADSRRIKQVLFVLLDNAIKFTPSGGEVSLRVWVESQTAVFQVEDTGTGIPIDQQSQLFQTFHQLDPAYNRTHEGAGLGLAMAKKFIDLHRGWIEVSSVEGKGSVFTVELPNQKLQPPPEAEAVVNSIASSGRIILVEDDEDTANLMCDMLTAAGYQVIWTVEVSTAIEQARLLQPEVVIIDIDQPVQNRLEMIRQLRKRLNTDQPIKILVMVAAEHDALGTAAAHVDAYLSKPVDPQYLVHRIDRLLQPTNALV
ncbi:Non-motile and phage-resistance protein [Acaryochloris thomasi RCC1774]|uniref:histidine kinase n=1 Tax=Acaryochloris thomasi RCC1774 TaxID=1764569 RepID=A0A2W1K5M6_9CYAN|nr:GAF domain-containing hybrid sensor histidine kinase/response regulator [Acaryochloris thomasi]PZD75007.1 Non-motile and phage-resistance protein [Acaryochloris thomasi RCC1774]